MRQPTEPASCIWRAEVVGAFRSAGWSFHSFQTISKVHLTVTLFSLTTSLTVTCNIKDIKEFLLAIFVEVIHARHDQV